MKIITIHGMPQASSSTRKLPISVNSPSRITKRMLKRCSLVNVNFRLKNRLVKMHSWSTNSPNPFGSVSSAGFFPSKSTGMSLPFYAAYSSSTSSWSMMISCRLGDWDSFRFSFPPGAPFLGLRAVDLSPWYSSSSLSLVP
jgi:hypothetical protein